MAEEHVTTTSNDPLLSGEDRLKLTELMELCTKLQSRVLALETTKANQVLEIRSLKRRVKKLEKNASKKTHKLKRLGGMINTCFDNSILDDEEVVAEKEVSIVDQVPTTGEVVTTVSVEVEAEVDNDQREAEMKMYMKIIPNDEITIDDIPLATKPPIIVDWKIIKEGKINSYYLIKDDKLVKAKYGNTMPEEGYARVLWGDLKVVFELNMESEVWRKLQGNKVTIWKLFSSCGVHFVRFQNMNIFMLVEKRYPLTPTTITEMLNKKLQADH
nr:hypothetical protein [Tanacetum cinerariifolium]